MSTGALGKILLAGLIFGSGVVILFGFLLLGLKYVNTSKGEGGRAVGYILAIGCGFVCLAAVVLGIYAITQKPSSKKPTASPSRRWSLRRERGALDGRNSRHPAGRPL